MLFVTSDASAVAGVGPCLLDVLRHINSDQVEPVVVYPPGMGRRPSIVPEIEKLGVPALPRSLGSWLPGPRAFGIRHLMGFVRTLRPRVWSLAQLIRRHDADLVYSNGLPCIDGALAARRTGRPHVWHVHESARDNPDLRSYLPAAAVVRVVRRLSDAVIVNSEFLAKEFSAGRNDTLVKVVHNGIDIDSISQAASPGQAAALRRELAVPAGGRLIVAVGTVAPRKGYETLVRAANAVLRAHPDAIFAIAGAQLKDYAASLSRLIDELGLGTRFRLLGPRQDVPELLAACDVMVHSARQETFGRVLVEAMALAKPVVATRCGGPEEIVVDGKTGFLVPVDDAPALAEKIVKLLDDPALATEMGQRGRQRAMEHFSVQTYSARIADIIGGLARSARRSPLGDM